MTETQIREAYANWLPESARGQERELFSRFFSDVLTVNFDLFEDEERLISRIYYLVPHWIDNRFACFVFYKESTFRKVEGGDLQLIHWDYGIGEPLLYDGSPTP